MGAGYQEGTRGSLQGDSQVCHQRHEMGAGAGESTQVQGGGNKRYTSHKTIHGQAVLYGTQRQLSKCSCLIVVGDF